MTRLPVPAVVDASVAVKIFVPEELSREAHSVFAAFTSEDEAELLVPELFFSECANVFWKWVQRWQYPAEKAREHLHDLIGIGLTVISNQVVAPDALDLALKHRITVYDGCYVALALQSGIPLITADRKLVNQLSGACDQIHWLGDLD